MSNDQLIKYLVDRVEKIDAKVDRLLEFKWQIIGGSLVASVFITGAIQIILYVMKP